MYLLVTGNLLIFLDVRHDSKESPSGTILRKQVKSMRNHYAKVKQFMMAGGQRTRDRVDRSAPKGLRLLGAKLILEEAREVCDELGVEVDIIIKNVLNIGVIDAEKLAKELCDLHVVTTWNQIAYGIPPETQDQVDDNNLAKFGPGWSKNEFGKVIPGPDFCKMKYCDLSQFLQE